MPATTTTMRPPDDSRVSPAILVAGVGNLFLGDDGFGPEVARRLATTSLPDDVRVTDYGVGGIHLAYDLLDGPATLVLIDVSPRGEEPGTVSVVEVTAAGEDAPPMDAHAMDPAIVLATVRRLGGEIPRTIVVACEPSDLQEGIGLSPPVAAAVEPTVAAVIELIDRERARIASDADAADETGPGRTDTPQEA